MIENQDSTRSILDDEKLNYDKYFINYLKLNYNLKTNKILQPIKTFNEMKIK